MTTEAQDERDGATGRAVVRNSRRGGEPFRGLRAGVWLLPISAGGSRACDRLVADRAERLVAKEVDACFLVAT